MKGLLTTNVLHSIQIALLDLTVNKLRGVVDNLNYLVTFHRTKEQNTKVVQKIAECDVPVPKYQPEFFV